jgi:hypothetical protein
MTGGRLDTAYENRIRQLEERKIEISRKSKIAAVRYAASTRHLELRSTFSQTRIHVRIAIVD